ncbi:hypothetical protein [Sphingomonas trueperi]|uniref:Uncharacterized protein n=1 Tax=Sphingomonas trueperi TaxID=53317 RepID=A0A7X6BE73_9SPHN|nr:hypothetical protein [Sphingomonas trueperi]NJB99889.1 hypothetical protein [Sphingomonas trueperi]
MATPIASQDRFTCGLGYIMQRLGQSHRSARWQIAYVNQLIESEGFPRPLPYFTRTATGGGRMFREARNASRWPTGTVDQWFDGHAPAMPDAAAEREAVEEMDEAASRIGQRFRVIDGGIAA